MDWSERLTMHANAMKKLIKRILNNLVMLQHKKEIEGEERGKRSVRGQYSPRDWCGKRMTILFPCPYKYLTIEHFLSHNFNFSLTLLSPNYSFALAPSSPFRVSSSSTWPSLYSSTAFLNCNLLRIRFFSYIYLHKQWF